MGCAIAKLDSEVSLQCKQRRKLIKSAARCREDFSIAHLTYIQTLKDVGRALRRFSEARSDADADGEDEDEDDDDDAAAAAKVLQIEERGARREALMDGDRHGNHGLLHLTGEEESSGAAKGEPLKAQTLGEEKETLTLEKETLTLEKETADAAKAEAAAAAAAAEEEEGRHGSSARNVAPSPAMEQSSSSSSSATVAPDMAKPRASAIGASAAMANGDATRISSAGISSANAMESPDMFRESFASPYPGYGSPSDRATEFYSPPFFSPSRDDSDDYSYYSRAFSPSSSHVSSRSPPPMPSPIRSDAWFLSDIFDPPPIPYNLLEHRRRRSEIDDFEEIEHGDDVDDGVVDDDDDGGGDEYDVGEEQGRKEGKQDRGYADPKNADARKKIDARNAAAKDVDVMHVDVRDVDRMRREEGIPDLEEDELQEEGEEAKEEEGGGGGEEGASSSKIHSNSVIVEKKVVLEDRKSSDAVEVVALEEDTVAAAAAATTTTTTTTTTTSEQKLKQEEDAMGAKESPRKELLVISHGNGIDLGGAVRHIHRHFSRAHRSGQDVSSMLETQLAVHHLNGLDLKEHSKVFNAITAHWSRKTSVALKDTYKDSDVADCGMSGSHAATLERLCAWEGKLYEEVKAGERTRMAFDRKRNQLYNLEAKGGEREAIDRTRVTLTKLENRLEVALKAIELASSRIQKVTNEELYPQLAELAGGLSIMWRVMWECHKAQNAIASEMQNIENSAASSEASDAHFKATVDLQRELEKWKTHFQQWISSQLKYIETLYLWLQKCHIEPPDESEVPEVLHFLSNWCNHLKELQRQDQVALTIDTFTGVVHSLELEQEGEMFMKKNTDKHARELERRSEKKYLGYGNGEGMKEDVDTQRSELESGIQRHSEVMQDRKERTLSSFKQHLPLIFDAMAAFAKDASKAYEAVHPSSREKADHI